MMRRRFALVALAAALACCAFGSARARAAAQPDCTSPPTTNQVVRGTHFEVNYSDDPQIPGFISQSQAGSILAAAERAYARYVADGFPAPAITVATGKTELYVTDLTQWTLAAIYGNGCVIEDKKTVTGDQMDYSVGNDVFTQIVQALGGGPQWMINGLSAWASWRALGYPGTSISDIGPFDMALDCDSNVSHVNCSSVGYENDGESRWPFYEYLTEKYGPLFIENIIAATIAAQNGTTGLDQALAAKGSSLNAEYGAYAAKLLTHSWTASTLNAATVPLSGSKIQTGISSGAIPSESFGINHLATKYVEIDRGDGSGTHACYAATLTLRVQIPAGVSSQPTFYWAGAGGGSPLPLAVSGNTASATVPWDTCSWQSHGYLAVPNMSLVDGTSFVVSGTLSVDFSTPASAAVPPAPATQSGQVIDAGSFTGTPTLTLYGPALLKIAKNAKELRLLVASTGEGSVTAVLGSTVLGTAAVSPGGNDLRFNLPLALLQSLRRSAGTLTLTLTPMAPDAKTKGTPVTRQVSMPTLAAKKRVARKK